MYIRPPQLPGGFSWFCDLANVQSPWKPTGPPPMMDQTEAEAEAARALEKMMQVGLRTCAVLGHEWARAYPRHRSACVYLWRDGGPAEDGKCQAKVAKVSRYSFGAPIFALARWQSPLWAAPGPSWIWLGSAASAFHPHGRSWAHWVLIGDCAQYLPLPSHAAPMVWLVERAPST